MQLEFFGAAGEVTGSCHILRAGGRQLLLDCGMIQGGRDAPRRNREPFPFDAAAIDAVVLSHAHLDHCGRLPLLVQRGFRGPIYTNAACADLTPILLRDSANLALRDAERGNRHLDPGEPRISALYDLADVDATLGLLRAIPYDTERELLPGITVRVRDAGHIMGSSSIELWVGEAAGRRKLVFSGDLGQYDSPILMDPFRFESADAVLMESTYGDRRHRTREDTRRELGAILAAAASAGGNVIVPAFAIGRSQELLYLLARHYAEWNLARWHVFLDSPMAIEARARYAERLHELDPELRPEQTDEKGPLGPADRNESMERRRAHAAREKEVCAFCTDRFRAINSVEESKQLTRSKVPAVIISSSGMATGGRVLHHLKAALPDPRNTVLFVGYQAAGTRGRRLVDGEAAVKIHGVMVPVQASVKLIGSMSAHADANEILRWLGEFRSPPRTTFLVHGDPDAMDALSSRIAGGLAWKTRMPEQEEIIDLRVMED